MARNGAQRSLKVCNLFNAEGEGWDECKMFELVGVYNTQLILEEMTRRDDRGGMEDRLVFKPARNGCFSVKEAYRTLHCQGGAMVGLVPVLGTSKEL